MHSSRDLWLELEVRRKAIGNEGWALQSSQLAAQVKEVVDMEQTMDHPIGYRSLEDRSRVRLGNRTRPMEC